MTNEEKRIKIQGVVRSNVKQKGRHSEKKGLELQERACSSDCALTHERKNISFTYIASQLWWEEFVPWLGQYVEERDFPSDQTDLPLFADLSAKPEIGPEAKMLRKPCIDIAVSLRN